MLPRWPLVAAALLACCAAQLAAIEAFSPAPSNVGLAPQRLMAYGKTHYWQLADGAAVGTMVLIHGCGPGARAFFPHDPVLCPECEGVPEYLSQTKQALARGYHVLALQANNEAGNCWSSSTRNGNVDDRPHVVATVAQFLHDHDAQGLPVFMQGYSSGGTMLLKLPAYLADPASVADLRIDGIVAVDAAPRGGFNAEDDAGRLKRGISFPPTLFVVAEPGGAAQRAPDQIKMLRDNDVPADMIVSSPRKVTPTFFSDRIPTLVPGQSQELVGLMQQLGGLAADGSVLPNVWGALDASALQLPWLSDGATHFWVATQLRIALGEHENLGEFTTASLAWLESGGMDDVAQLVRDLTPAQPAAVTIVALPQQFVAAASPLPAPTSGA